MQIEINRNQPKLYPFSLKNTFISIKPSLNFQIHLHQKHPHKLFSKKHTGKWILLKMESILFSTVVN